MTIEDHLATYGSARRRRPPAQRGERRMLHIRLNQRPSGENFPSVTELNFGLFGLDRGAMLVPVEDGPAWDRRST